MPLAFPCLSHGTVAFGFFNIETDLLLLEHYFFFAEAFCRWISLLARHPGQEPMEYNWEVLSIENRTEIGDLMGAIHGIRYSGFIGEVYTNYPFPRVEADFKQNPEGFRTQPVVEKILRKYAVKTEIPFRIEQDGGRVLIGEYVFTAGAFQSLVEYVWLGGYPRWKEGVRPEYVVKMKTEIEESHCWLFEQKRLPNADAE